MNHMQDIASFVAKVSSVKTRTKDNKDYFVFRMNIPKEVADQLSLVKDDYLFLRAMKAKWYHMVNWQEMPLTWEKMPNQLRDEILSSGMEVPYGKLDVTSGMTPPTRPSTLPEPMASIPQWPSMAITVGE